MHVVVNKKKRVFSLLLLFKQEFDWMSIKPIEFTDRLLGGVGGGGQGSKSKTKFSGRELHRQIRSGGSGCWTKKNTSRFVISRGWHLCNNKLLNHVYILQATYVCYICPSLL